MPQVDRLDKTHATQPQIMNERMSYILKKKKSTNQNNEYGQCKSLKLSETKAIK